MMMNSLSLVCLLRLGFLGAGVLFVGADLRGVVVRFVVAVLLLRVACDVLLFLGAACFAVLLLDVLELRFVVLEEARLVVPEVLRDEVERVPEVLLLEEDELEAEERVVVVFFLAGALA